MTKVEGYVTMPHESLVTMPSAQESVAAATAMFDDSTRAILKSLRDSGIPKLTVDHLEETFKSGGHCHAEALNEVQSYTHCYPYMDTATLVDLLEESWEGLCNRRDAETREVNRRIDRLRKVDTKKKPAAAELLKEAQEAKTKLSEQRTINQLGLYRIRALKSVYIQARANENIPSAWVKN